MNTLDFTVRAGWPASTETWEWLQNMAQNASLASLLGGRNYILSGMEDASGNTSNGLVVINGEILIFEGGPTQPDIIIVDTPTTRAFFGGANNNYYHNRKAVFGSGAGSVAYASLTRNNPDNGVLARLDKIWLPGDLKQKYVDNAYIAANYDVNGYGLNLEAGWRILSSAVPAAAGKVLVNRDAADADFDACGDNGGSKTYTISKNELPAVNILNIASQSTVTTGGYGMMKKSSSGANVTPTSTDTTGSGNELDIVNIAPFPNLGSGTPIPNNNLQPYFVVLTLIKL